MGEGTAAAGAGAAAPFVWTVAVVVRVVLLFVLAGLCEISGGWLVWKAVRDGGSGSNAAASATGKQEEGEGNASAPAPWHWGLWGSLLLITYGFVVTLQPLDDFGRLYAAYGGLFIAMSLIWARAVDGFVADLGDVLGAALCMAGALLMLFWPREATAAEVSG